MSFGGAGRPPAWPLVVATLGSPVARRRPPALAPRSFCAELSLCPRLHPSSRLLGARRRVPFWGWPVLPGGLAYRWPWARAIAACDLPGSAADPGGLALALARGATREPPVLCGSWRKPAREAGGRRVRGGRAGRPATVGSSLVSGKPALVAMANPWFESWSPPEYVTGTYNVSQTLVRGTARESPSCTRWNRLSSPARGHTCLGMCPARRTGPPRVRKRT